MEHALEEEEDDAEELFMLMEGSLRVSRNVRAKWFFQNLGRKLNYKDDNLPPNADGIRLVGGIPKSSQNVGDELRVSPTTVVTYFSNCYRLIFVMDLSPSAFSTDESGSGSVFYTRILKVVKSCLENVVKSFDFPGSKIQFRPQIYITFCAFSPFLCFTHESVLLQGVLLNEETIDLVVANLIRKFHSYVNDLCSYCQPYLSEWQVERRKFRKFADKVASALYDVVNENGENIDSKELRGFPKSFPDFKENSAVGFIQPDWALVFMVRLGLMAVQMLPEHTQSNLVIVTDGICAIPDGDALQNLISQLRSLTITCSFIQLEQSSLKGPSLGHVGFTELFKFLAKATFGKFLYEKDLVDVPDRQLSFYHRAFLSWNFQRAYDLDDESKTLDILGLNNEITRNRRFSHSYYTSLYKLLYVRLREGYTIKSVSTFVRDNVEMIRVQLSLLWETRATIDYIVSSPWIEDFQELSHIYVELFIEGSVDSQMELFTDIDGADPLKDTVTRLLQVDGLLVHLHSFCRQPAFYQVPKELQAENSALFEQKAGKFVITEKSKRLSNRTFTKFWAPACNIDESLWQKLVHMHTVRLLLTEDDYLPRQLFTKHDRMKTMDEITCQTSSQKVIQLLNQEASFTLVKDSCFVKFVKIDCEQPPQYFYIIRAVFDIPCVILKMAFLGGLSSKKRSAIVHELCSRICAIKGQKSYNLMTKSAELWMQEERNKLVYSKTKKTFETSLARVVNRPLERILVRYSKVPTDISNIVRLEDSSDSWEIREMIMHNAIAKYMSCRRFVWELKPVFPRLDKVSRNSMEFILEIILRRRLKQGFSIAYGCNGIVNLTRQLNQGTSDSLPRVEQCVLFGPVYTDTELTNETKRPNVDDDLGIPTVKKPRNKASKGWPRIATEVWLEPRSCLEETGDDNSDPGVVNPNDIDRVKREELLKEDDAIVRALFTFDQLMHATESGLYAEEAHNLDKVASPASKEQLSAAVDLYQDVFDPKSLMDHADQREFMLMPSLGFTEEDNEDRKLADARLESLLKYVQSELTAYAECCVDALDDAFLWNFVEDCQQHFGINRFYSPEDTSFDAVVNVENTLKLSRKCNGRFMSPMPSSSASSDCSTDGYTNDHDPNDSEAVLDEDKTDPFVDSPLNRSLSAVANDPSHDSTFTRNQTISSLQSEISQKLRSTSVPTFPDPIKDTLDSPTVNKSLLDAFDEAIAYSSSSLNEIGSGSSGGYDEGSPSRKPSGTGEKSRHASGQRNKEEKRDRKLSGSPVHKILPRPKRTLEDLEKQHLAVMRQFPKSPLGGFGIYARRLNPHRLVFFAVPKNAKTVRLLMPHCTSGFPVMVYYVDKLRMAQRFVESGFGEVQNVEIIVEDFTEKARISTLASLNQQIREGFVGESCSLDEFYLRGLETDGRALSQHPEFTLSSFDLKSYAEQVFEEYMFTKAYVAATFVAIGQQVLVPKSVLQETTEYRSEHVSLEVGQVHSMMRNKCIHLELYENVPNKFTNSEIDLDPLTLKPLPSPETMRKSDSKKFFRLFNGCLSKYNEWKECFQRLLTSYHFKKVPGLDDFYYFWPHGKPVIRFQNVDDVSSYFKDVFRAVDENTKGDNLSGSHQDPHGIPPGNQYDDDDIIQLSSTDIWPLFIQFSIGVIGPEGEMDSFPMANIPNCLTEISSKCANRVLHPVCEGIGCHTELKIIVDMYILTWPLPSNSPFQLTDPHLIYARYQENQQYLAEMEEEKYASKSRHSSKHQDDRDEKGECSVVIQDADYKSVPHRQEGLRRANEFLNQLPKVEHATITQLHLAVKRLISTELFFDYGRLCELPPPSPQPTWRMLSSMFCFVRQISRPTESDPYSVVNYPEATFMAYEQRLVLIGDVEDGVKRLGERLDGLPIEYVNLRRMDLKNPTVSDFEIPEEYFSAQQLFDDDPDPFVFYASSVDDPLRLEETLQERSAASSVTQKRRASSCGLVLETVVRNVPDQKSSSEFSSEVSESETETIDLVQPLNDKADNDVCLDNPNGELAGRRSRLKRQASRYHSSSSFSRASSLASKTEGETSGDDDDDIRVLSSGSEGRISQTDGFVVGSDCGTLIAEEQVCSGGIAPLSPLKPAIEAGSAKMKNGFPLEWLQKSGIYDESSDVSSDESSQKTCHDKTEAYRHDFWIMIHVRRGDQYKTSVYFFCRYNSPHKALFHKAVFAVEKQIKVVNQQLLLDQLHQTEECDQLLLDSPDKLDKHNSASNQPQQRRQVTFFTHERIGNHVRNFMRLPSETDNDRGSDDEDSHTSDVELEGGLDTEWMHYARCKYPPGYFACDIVWHHWFEIHPRLQPTNRLHSGGADMGIKAIRMGLELFAVRNRPNLYVFKEANGNVIYMRIFSCDEQQLGQEFKDTPGDKQPKMPGRSRPGSHVLWAIYGIKEPSPEVTEQMREMLQKKLDMKTLEEIQNVLLKNAQVRLDYSDAKFIQRDPHQPAEVYFYSIPKAVAPFHRAFLGFLEQQLETFCTPPHVREQSGAFSPVTPRSPNPSAIHRTHHHSVAWAFCPFVPEGAPKNPPDYNPKFYLINKPPGEGRRDVGLACIEVKLLNSNMEWISHPSHAEPSDLANPLSGFVQKSQLTFHQRMVYMQSLACCEKIFDPVRKQRGEYPALIEFNVWQNGNVNLEELDHKFMVTTQQAVCDILTEYGLLAMSMFESAGVQSHSGSFTLPTSNPKAITGTMDPKEIAAYRAQQIAQSRQDQGPTHRRHTVLGDRRRLGSDVSSNPGLQPFHQPQCPPSPVHQLHPQSQPNPLNRMALQLDDDFMSKVTAAAMADYKYDVPGSPNPSSGGSNDSKADGSHPTPPQNSTPALSSTAMGIYGFYQHEDNMTPPSSISRHHGNHSGGNSNPQGGLQSPYGSVVGLNNMNRSSSGSGGGDNVRQASPALHASVAAALGKSMDESQFQAQVQLPPRLASMGANPPSGVVAAAINAVANITKSDHSPTRPRQASHKDNAISTPPPQSSSRQSPAGSPVALEWMRVDFAQTAADWLEYCAHGTKNAVNVDNSVKRCTFMLDCDGSARKIMQVVFDRLKPTFKSERLTICKCVSPSPGMPSTDYCMPSGRKLQTLNSINTLLEPIEVDLGRAITIDEDEEIELVLFGFYDKQTNPSPKGKDSKSSFDKSVDDGGRIQRFAPLYDPFIPRKRVFYLVARGETITMFLYNYTKDLCDKAREIVKRTVLWHNARSRLLREIGLHKMGVTHLSTLKTNETKYNSYLLLTWLDPETLVRNEYPPDDLKTPDFSKIPRKYAQLLLKLYRFSDSAFVAKNFSADPFEDQTQQMLTLRDDVRAKLNDHRLFDEIHRSLINGHSELREDGLVRITSRSHHAHFVQSPLLLFTSWRYQIAQIRKNLASHVGISGRAADGGVRSNFPSLTGNTQKKASIPDEKQGAGGLKSSLRPKNSSGPSTKNRSKTMTFIQNQKKPELGEEVEAHRKPSNMINSAPLHSVLSHPKIEDEFCILKIQYMLVEDYVHYLQLIGLNLLKIHSENQSQAFNLQYTADCTQAPNVWLYLAKPGGIIFAHVTFVEPYFAVSFLFWNASQLGDYFHPDQAVPQKDLDDMRQIELIKNDLISRCHVHSFTYDFHLRMVSKYLTGGQQVLFNRGYNTNAFLIDFLQYYGCRPPFAQNCIYEERATFESLKVTSHVVWEYFLNNEAQFGWEVVRIKNVEANEYMLVSKELREISGHKYTLISVVLNDTRAGHTNAHHIDLKLYVIMVAEEFKFSLSDATGSMRRRAGSGEFARKATSTESLSTAHSLIYLREPTYSGSNSSNASGTGGEFTRVERPDILRQNEISQSYSEAHVSRMDSFRNQMLKEKEIKALDELIAMSTDELMYDIGIRPPRQPASTSKQRRHYSGGDINTLRRKSESGNDRNDKNGSAPPVEHGYLTGSQKNCSQIGSRMTIRSASAETRKTETRRNSEAIPQTAASSRRMGGSLTKLNFSDRMDEVWKQPEDTDNSFVSFDISSGDKERLSIQKSPMRRHHQAYLDGLLKRQSDAVLPPEQVTYVHYLSNQQRRLQHLLEESAKVKKEELKAFVHEEADKICYINSLWKRMHATKTTSGSRRPHGTTLFATKNDSGGDSNSAKSVVPEMSFEDLEAMLKVVKVQEIGTEQPQVESLLKDLNFTRFIKFMKSSNELVHRCRYFDHTNKRIIVFLTPGEEEESALMIMETAAIPKLQLFLLIKDTSKDIVIPDPPKVYRHFEQIVNFIGSFVLLDLVNNMPSLP
ncbi:unnamed protein product [Bursaphelenchus xylophilus]|uniref:(pine wood nematode) hypothetical protein n=1 Tax=Bursaphelenchus xylophilus TaxID=6326 RepID=A0A1I7SW15_BURXY|nr:unnamed protein product [Bursaphelenchus xylophilus]CAG9098655.1 unnamed protein product [Bursaphelenchus xylophilus]